MGNAADMADGAAGGVIDRATSREHGAAHDAAAKNVQAHMVYEGAKAAMTGDVGGLVSVVATDAKNNLFGTSDSNQDYGSNGTEIFCLGNPVCPGCQKVRYGKGCDKGKISFMKWKCCRCQSNFQWCRMCAGQGGKSGRGRPPS